MDFVDRFPLYPLIVAFLLYPLAALPVLRWSPRRLMMPLFATLNIAFLAVLCFLSGASSIRLKYAVPYSKLAALFFVFYLLIALLHFVLLRRMQRHAGAWITAAFCLPLAFLVYFKYLSDDLSPFKTALAHAGVAHLGAFFIGISYLSFRLTHMTQEVRNGFVEVPTLSEYMAFAFFTPTMASGPINPYSRFIRSMRQPDRERTPLDRSLLRILVGFTKYMFLGALAGQFTYASLLLDGHPHARIDLVLAVCAYPIYLYLNFSGFCDMAIGVAGILQVEVIENFDRPFLARNLPEFWNRWHMSLSQWIRDLAFTPLSKILVRRMGSRHANDAIAIAIFISFIGVGIWHGKGWNFVAFGVLQGAGIVTVQYYTLWLKKSLGRERFAAYRNNLPIRVASTVTTFLYFSFTLFFFANTWDQMHDIFQALRLR